MNVEAFVRGLPGQRPSSTRRLMLGELRNWIDDTLSLRVLAALGAVPDMGGRAAALRAPQPNRARIGHLRAPGGFAWRADRRGARPVRVVR